ncbi:MAG: NlpC/P60 family protein [Segetibacter sp.]|nr:NlpC/P60 family protein [Segetibacter sp.]
MSFLICVVPVCPVRSEGSHRNEQVSQLLFGEVAELLESTKDFVKVRCLHDGYIGWCQTSQLETIEDEAANFKRILAPDYLNSIACNGSTMHIPFGSNVGYFDGRKQIGKLEFDIKTEGVSPSKQLISEAEIERLAMLYLNTSYQWGGRSIFGVDCSGFTQTVFSFFDIALQRDAYQQATQGEAIGFLQEVKCGDLAFFDNEEGRITHVGIMLSPDTIVHASGKVRIDTIDYSGIVNRETGVRTHKLRIIKRVVV